ncbi:MAG: hypothetical protein HY606_06475 [Planctomycetes bacterium]|nr:hypothetical protein [Planctomycetota bacterium]
MGSEKAVNASYLCNLIESVKSVEEICQRSPRRQIIKHAPARWQTTLLQYNGCGMELRTWNIQLSTAI